MSSDILTPKQDRSRDTLTRLLKATVSVLESDGLDGATIPKIAAAAGVAPASVYRRFKDRDALLRAAFTEALGTGAASTRAVMKLESFKDRTFAGVVRALVGLQIRQYRAAPGLMRAFIRFAEVDTDQKFRASAMSSIGGNFEAIIELLLTFRDEIKHADPKRALTFAMSCAATVVEEVEVEEVSMWHHLLPLSDQELQEELTRQALAYLRG